jgi:hypothetical protein
MGCCISIKITKTKIKPKPEDTDNSIHYRTPIVSSRSYKIISNDVLNLYRISKISSGAMRSSGSDISHYSVHRPHSHTKNNVLYTNRMIS